MIKKLQKKFIVITALSLLFVMLVLVAGINGMTVYSNIKSANEEIDFIFKNGGVFPDGKSTGGETLSSGAPSADETHPEPPKHSGEDSSSAPYAQNRNGLFDHSGLENPEKKFTMRFCSVVFDADGNITAINSDNQVSLTDDEISSYASEIAASGKESGRTANYAYKYSAYSDGYLLVMLDTSADTTVNYSTLLTSCLIAIISYVAALFLIILFSRKAINPIAESYEKQKTFITDAGHELKTPLTVISANNEIIEMTYGENEWTKATEKQVGKMQNLVCNLIDLAKMDEGEVILAQKEFALSDAVFDTAKAFESPAISKQKVLELNIEPDIMWTGDEAGLRQVISILLDNAVKYCDDGGTITVSVQSEKNIVITVSNSFKDVGNMELGKLFDRFYREDKARSGGSYGLGLSIAKAVVEKQHGAIRARNLDNSRIAFEIRLRKNQ